MWGPLAQPYPFYHSPYRRWFTVFGMGVFVFLFLLAFRPFGLNNVPDDLLYFILLGYGLTCSVILCNNLIIIPALFPSLFKEENWTVMNEILLILFNISCVGLGNAVFTFWKWNDSITFSSLMHFQLITILVAFLPVSGLVLLKNTALLRKNLAEARNLSDSMHHKKRLDAFKSDVVLLIAENPRDNFRVAVNDLLYLNSADNYIEIHYLENGVLKNKLLRSSLKNARNDLRNYTAFYRCHRAWIVNLDKVSSITGNSQGYRLVMEKCETRIPVSRNLNEEITLRLSK